MRRITGWSLVACLIAVLATGCMPWRGPEDVRREVHDVTGASYDKEFGLTLGPTAMAIARWGVGLAADDDEDVQEIQPMLKGIRKVEVGVWQVKRRPQDGLGRDRQLTSADFPTWFPMVEATPPEGDAVLVLTREGKTPGSIKRMLVVVDDEDELVVVRMRGRLERVFEEAVSFAFEEVERQELTEPTLAEYRARQASTAPAEPASVADAQ